MNIQQLRQSLKLKWVNYYYKNRSWLVKMRIWATYDGQRRPSSGFILATLSALEPQMEQLLPFILELNNNPDQIITALGLNFNPEDQLHLVKDNFVAENQEQSESSSHTVVTQKPSSHTRDSVKPFDHSCAVSKACSERDSASRRELPLGDRQPSASRTATTEIKKPISSFTPISADRSAPHANLISEDKAVQPISIATKVQNKGKPTIPITLTNVENNSVISIAVTGIESKSKPLTSAAFASKAKNHSNVTLSNAVTTKVERKSLLSTAVDCQRSQSKNKLVSIEMKDLPNNEVTVPSTNKACKLANWIDDFCQGKEWDRREAGFIPF